MKQRKTIAVTGSTGRVGHLVAEILLSSGHRVRAVARSAERLAKLEALGAEICVGSLEDRHFLTQVFHGCDGAFVLSPVDTSAPDVNAEQMRNVKATAAAVADSRVKNVVLLSSWGAELPEQVGGIIACRHFERLLNGIPGLNAVYLRPVWFMENFLWNIPLVKMAGINGLAIRRDVSFPMIATGDIAPIAAGYLADLDFRGRNIRYLEGAKNYTMNEVTRILGVSIGRPNLKYIEFPKSVMRQGLIKSGGLSPNAAGLAVEINQAISNQCLKAEMRSESNTTPTTLEEFAQTTFAPAFREASAASVSDRLGGLLLRSFLFLIGSRA
jgi:uncharacterized protein YbjT (DUF2867 family)